MNDAAARLATALADRYRVERELGQGGMATVYLAHDLKHDRKVALKVLRPELAAVIGGERFLAEIRTTANLQHPHILSLFDSGEVGGTVFYVMPFVEGESLRDRLTRETQLPIDVALRITSEVADALGYAHAKGIIHRDIKPENILLHGGHALVADFGIALAVSRSDGGSRMTETGMSLGTPHYMSPEQAMGERTLDQRTDIYALGAMTYEMLVGEPPFTGPSAQAIVAKVMTSEPASLIAQRKTVPPHIEAAVLTALSKLPADRFSSAAQFAAALGDPGFVPSATLMRTQAVAPPRPLRARLLAAAPWALCAVLGGAAAWQRFRPGPPPPSVLRIAMEMPVVWEDQTGQGVAISPDGKLVVYSGRDSTGGKLFLRRMDEGTVVPISGSNGAILPFISPDDQRIGFQIAGRLVQVPVSGGAVEAVCTGLDRGATYGATWLDGNTVVVADSGGLRECLRNGEVRPLLRLPDSLGQVTWPHALPEKRGVLYTQRYASRFELAVYDLKRRTAQRLNIAGTDARYVAAGYLVYANLEGVLRAVPFDLDRLEVTGPPETIMEGVRVGGGGAAKVGVALNGMLVTTMGQAGRRTLELVDRQGRADRMVGTVQTYFFPRFSPDGQRVAVNVGPTEISANIWILDRRQGTLTRLTFDSGATRPSWSPDGRRIVYSGGGGSGLRIINADGSAPAESLLTVPGLQLFQSLFASDGRTLVVRTTGRNGRDIWRLPLDSTRVLRPLLQTPAEELSATLSPDGHWMGYVSDESGRQEVYVRPFPAMGARYQVSLDGGIQPVWSPRGGEIFYRSGASMMVATVRTSPTFEVLRRTSLFTNPEFGDYAGWEPSYDVAPDGQHFVMIRTMGLTSGLTLTLNWFENLRAGRLGSGTREGTAEVSR